jgi:cation diffusion facilitator family transporter
LSSSQTHADTIRSGYRVTLVGALVNVLLVVFKFMAGWLGNSQAMIADAVHTVSDLFTDVVVLLGLKMGRAPADQNHHFGHARLETMTSAVVGLALMGVAVYIGLTAAFDIYHHTVYQPTWLAVAAAAVSIASKEALYRYTAVVGRRINSAAVLANAWHHRSDALSSVAVLLGVGAAALNPDWHILDAYAAFLVSFFVLKAGLDIVWQALKEFTDAAPRPEVLAKIKDCARGVVGVMEVHDLKARVSGGRYQMELHIGVDGSLQVTEGHRIAKDVEKCLRREVALLEQVIIHVDPHQENSSSQARKTPAPPTETP